MTVVPPKPPTVVRAEGPAPSVGPKEPTLPGRPAHNSSSNTSSNNRFATNGRPRPLLPTPRLQQPQHPKPHNRPTAYSRPPANLTSRAAQSQTSSIPLTNRFSALQDQHTDTPNVEQTFLVVDSIVRPLQETWRGWDNNGRHKSRKVLCRPGARINDFTRQVKNLRCQKKDLTITHVSTNNLQKMGSEKLIDDMEQLCETARAKTDSHIVIGLHRYKACLLLTSL